MMLYIFKFNDICFNLKAICFDNNDMFYVNKPICFVLKVQYSYSEKL